MLEFVDLFCGAGGMSYGLARAGLTQRLGVDADVASIATYSASVPRSTAVVADVATLSGSDILASVASRDNLVLAGCPPCQLFSRLQRSRVPVTSEIDAYLRLLWSTRPAYVVFENVPQLRTHKKIWGAIQNRLEKMGYWVWSDVVEAHHFGVPQHRRRLLLIASRYGELTPRIPRRAIRTVRDAIRDLPSQPGDVANHRTMRLSPANAARIRLTASNGGSSRPTNVSFADSYARMYWDRPAPTITTKCISFSNGRFGHPRFHRAITVREAARLQGFPDSFVFHGSLEQTATQVGNAVPPPIAKWVGETITANFLQCS